MQFVDSHCHLNFPELATDLGGVLARMASASVTHALCVSVDLETFDEVADLVRSRDNLFGSIGVHPNHATGITGHPDALLERAEHPKIVAVGETGLDYYRSTGDLEWQRDRFRMHIQVARQLGKPLIVHTREAASDTLRILEEEQAAEAGGVMHCFSETWEVAQRALELGFYISFSGILTFKNADRLRDVASRVPLERILIETDSPYLAPIPYRGKTNEPGYVRHIAEELARIRQLPLETVAEATSANFFRLFREANADS
jgi:TatD DNase family protein